MTQAGGQPGSESTPQRRAGAAARPSRLLGPVVRRYRALARARKLAKVRLFFITGHPKSGTNWVANVANLHPEICCRGELHLQRLRQTVIDMRPVPVYYPKKRMRRAMEVHFARLVRECMLTFNRDRPGATVLGDHSPEPLTHMLQDPTARYVHITRDGRDVLISYTYHWLRAKMGQAVTERVYPLYLRAREMLDGSRERLDQAAHMLLADEAWVTDGAAHWANRVRRDQAVMNSDDNGMRTRTLALRYEQMHADIEAQRRRLYEFLGVDPTVASPLSAETRTLPGYSQNDPRSMHRKGVAGEWREKLGPYQRRWFDAAAGQELIDLGYEKDHSWVGGETVTGAGEQIVARVHHARGTSVA